MTRRITIAGTGAVSPAGWGMPALRAAMASRPVLETTDLPHPDKIPELSRTVRRVPKPAERLPFLTHPRLRRSSPVTQFATAAALEALGSLTVSDPARTGIVFSLYNGCVNYSGRFYGEVLTDPATASPILFPETVFNAPASHVATLLGLTGPVYSVIGDSAQFPGAVEIGVQWLLDGLVDRCLVIAAEECDWLTAEGMALLAPGTLAGEGAGALLLESDGTGPELRDIHGPVSLSGRRTRAAAAAELASSLTVSEMTLVDDQCGDAPLDAAVLTAFGGWDGPRISPALTLGHTLGAAAALQAVLAVESVRSTGQSAASVSIGSDQQAAALLFSA